MTREEWDGICEAAKTIACRNYLGIKPEEFDEFDPSHRTAQGVVIGELLKTTAPNPTKPKGGVTRKDFYITVIVFALIFFLFALGNRYKMGSHNGSLFYVDSWTHTSYDLRGAPVPQRQ